MVYGVNLVLADEPLQQVLIEDVADDGGFAITGQRFAEGITIEGDDPMIGHVPEVIDETVADLSIRSGDQDYGLAQESLPPRTRVDW